MVLKFRCARCGQPVFIAGDVPGKQARCPACDKVQQIPQASHQAPAEQIEQEMAGRDASVYELAAPPLDPARTNLGKTTRVVSKAAGTDSVWGLIRESALGTSQLQELSLCLIALSIADIIMTCTLLRTSHAYYESNPVAGWFFARWNMTGMVVFKFAAIAGAIALGEVIERRRREWENSFSWLDVRRRPPLSGTACACTWACPACRSAANEASRCRGGPRHRPSVRVRRDHLATPLVARLRQQARSMASRMKLKWPSQKRTLTPPGWKLPRGLPARVVIGDTIVPRRVRAQVVIVKCAQVVSIPPARALVEHPAAAGCDTGGIGQWRDQTRANARIRGLGTGVGEVWV